MPDRMSNRMSEDMSDRMPEDLPVRKCINVMVGITRSKVISWVLSWVSGDYKVNTHHDLLFSKHDLGLMRFTPQPRLPIAILGLAPILSDWWASHVGTGQAAGQNCQLINKKMLSL